MPTLPTLPTLPLSSSLPLCDDDSAAPHPAAAAAAPPAPPLCAPSSRRLARRVLQLERDEGHECHPTREELRVGYHCMAEHDQWLHGLNHHVNGNRSCSDCWHADMPSVLQVADLVLQFPNLASVCVPLRDDVDLSPGDVRMVLGVVAGLGALRSCHVQADVAGWVERGEGGAWRDEEAGEEEEKEIVAREEERRCAVEEGMVVKVAAREMVAQRGREIRRERKEARKEQERQQSRKEMSSAIEAGLLGVVSSSNGGNRNCLPAVLQSGSPFSALTSLKELRIRLRVAERGCRLPPDLFLGLESQLQKLTLLHTPCGKGNGDGDNGERGDGDSKEVTLVMPGSAWRLTKLQELETSFRVPFDDDHKEFEEGFGALPSLPNLQVLCMMADKATAGAPLPASLRRLQLRYNQCSLLHAVGRAAGSVEHLEVTAVGAGGQDSCVYGDLVPTLSPHRWDPAWRGLVL
ncbi:unnamed protein product [Closterium sp. Naga37s-1]|nr:unnamed protein product [Closterium sp. Naga37s-1]